MRLTVSSIRTASESLVFNGAFHTYPNLLFLHKYETGSVTLSEELGCDI